MSHIPNEQQEKAFKAVERAINKCKKLGLVIYAKQYDLVAYTKEANEYAEITNESLLRIGNYATIPHLSLRQSLADSGADDYACYISKEDENKYLNNDDYETT